ncbi:hypothetical protein WMC41_30725 (plasmid) [Shinella yambaruensis]|uniref:hypothetical protein n=1 Tax=Shinella yambaruensis TaxID=415996 RepID=UPI003D78FC21
MIHEENEPQTENPLRGVAYPLTADWTERSIELKEPGVTLLIHWEEIAASIPTDSATVSNFPVRACESSLRHQQTLDRAAITSHQTKRPRRPSTDRLQIGMLAGMTSEQMAGFVSESMAGFIGIRVKIERHW